MRRLTTISLLVLALALVACNVPGGGVEVPTSEPTPGGGEQPTIAPTGDTGQPPTAPAPTDAPPTAEPTDTGGQPTEEAPPTEAPPAETEPPASGVESCPAPGEGQEQYVDEGGGYCFLYPSEFTLHTDFTTFEHQVALAGPPLDPNSLEPIAVGLQVDMTGPAVYVSTSGEYAQMWRDITIPEMSLGIDEATIGGQPAAVIDGVPGRVGGRAAFIVVDGVKYTLNMQPEVGVFPDLDEQAEMLWELVTSSIVFFEPTELGDVVLAEDVCEEPGDVTQQTINLMEGYCFLYPAEFEADVDFAGGITAGPTVEVPNFGPMRARLVLAWAGDAQGQSPRDIIETWVETGIDPTSIEDTTIGGAPAVTYLDPRGPVHQIGAHIVANDQQYTIVGNPYDFAQYPEQAQLIDEMWEAMTGTVAFFDPWR